MAFSLRQLAEYTDATVHGDPECQINAINTLQEAGPGDISFLSHGSYIDYLKETRASAVVLSRNHLPSCPGSALVVDVPYLAYARISRLMYPDPPVRHAFGAGSELGDGCVIGEPVQVGSNVCIGDGVRIGKGTCIGSGSVIGANVVLGEDCRIGTNVSVYQGSRIGDRAQLESGVSIGSSSLAFAHERSGWLNIPQRGGVAIGDDVYIGANAVVERGAIGDTVVENGVKIAAQTCVAHNVCIGEHTIVSGGVLIAGSVRIGSHCAVGGGVSIAGHLKIADRVTISGGTIVLKSITRRGKYASGLFVTQTSRQWWGNAIRLSMLEALFLDVDRLKQRLLQDRRDC